MGLRVRTLGLKHASLRRATQLGWPGEVRRLRVDDLHQRARARRLQPGAPAVTEVARRVQGVSELRSFLGSKLRERFLLRGQTLPGLLAEWSIMDRLSTTSRLSVHPFAPRRQVQAHRGSLRGVPERDAVHVPGAADQRAAHARVHRAGGGALPHVCCFVG